MSDMPVPNNNGSRCGHWDCQYDPNRDPGRTPRWCNCCWTEEEREDLKMGGYYFLLTVLNFLAASGDATLYPGDLSAMQTTALTEWYNSHIVSPSAAPWVDSRETYIWTAIFEMLDLPMDS